MGRVLCLATPIWIVVSTAYAWSQAATTFWSHNGSTTQLVVEHSSRRIVYTSPRAGLAAVGVQPGTILFDGVVEGKKYKGFATVFSLKCGPAFFKVEGEASNNGATLVLLGDAPARDESCQSTGRTKTTLSFDYVSKGETIENRVTPKSSERGYFQISKTREMILEILPDRSVRGAIVSAANGDHQISVSGTNPRPEVLSLTFTSPGSQRSESSEFVKKDLQWRSRTSKEPRSFQACETSCSYVRVQGPDDYIFNEEFNRKVAWGLSEEDNISEGSVCVDTQLSANEVLQKLRASGVAARVGAEVGYCSDNHRFVLPVGLELWSVEFLAKQQGIRSAYHMGTTAGGSGRRSSYLPSRTFTRSLKPDTLEREAKLAQCKLEKGLAPHFQTISVKRCDDDPHMLEMCFQVRAEGHTGRDGALSSVMLDRIVDSGFWVSTKLSVYIQPVRSNLSPDKDLERLTHYVENSGFVRNTAKNVPQGGFREFGHFQSGKSAEEVDEAINASFKHLILTANFTCDGAN